MLWIYGGFILFVLAMLALDLGVFHRKAHVVGMKEALGWSAVWISLGLAFSLFIYLGYENHWMGLGKVPPGMAVLDRMAVTPANPAGELDGQAAVVKYVTGYLIEKSLSVDNIFVIAMIFAFLAVPSLYQHRVLFWGIIGALVMRGVMIAVGAELLTRFTWIIYVFGGFLILTGLKMLLVKGGETDLSKNWVVKFSKRLIPMTDRYHGQHFFVRAGSPASHEADTPDHAHLPEVPDRAVEAAKAGTLMMTPLFLGLLLVEVTDLVFAVDSIPAIFAITTDPFLVFTSNIFAILGLRSLYFALAGMMDKFRYLKVSLAFVLLLVGTKMMVHVQLKQWLGENFNLYLLGAVLAILAAGVLASLFRPIRPVGDGGELDAQYVPHK